MVSIHVISLNDKFQHNCKFDWMVSEFWMSVHVVLTASGLLVRLLFFVKIGVSAQDSAL